MQKHLKPKILIVDDQKSICDTVSTILETEKYEVHTSNDGYEAIEKVKETSYDIAFIDIKMPGINGVEVLREIRKISPETTVVMMTAYAVEELIKQALDEGAHTCIYKPFDMEKIIETIKNVTEKTILLIVDDDLNIRELFNLRLTEKGYKVVSVSSGEEAVKLAERKPPDVILLDVVMPDMDGIETLKKIKELLKEKLPEVIMMSSYDVENKIKQALELGARQFFKKPINVDILTRSIKELVENERTSGTPSVLIVDDDISLCTTLSDILTEQGYNVKVANSGSEAIEGIKHNYYKIILLDVKLPDVSSMEVYNEIKKINPDVTPILMTDYTKDETIVETIKKGDYICLYRPFDPQDMINIIQKICTESKKKSQ